MGFGLRGLPATALDIVGGKFCLTKRVPTNFFVFWLPMLVFEILLCVLAVVRAYKSYHESGRTIYGQRLFDILIRDSVLYFLAIGITYLTCFVVWILEPNILIEAPIGFSLAISCTLGNRMILNLRNANEQKGQQEVFIPLKAVK
ncbi:hypothetical protein GALMADRAFT_143706 [Galerina marginata CBS 339.88]|uniref:Uncharacterized protein n=1 Tax=Galerina marginata (strain CBS 339.88) TaxID=685588 RepID=A0A067SKK5_GALM3|nr:hypothetical protein GALMADRAFT_143706 [Galerina marginata CBS 339.88]